MVAKGKKTGTGLSLKNHDQVMRLLYLDVKQIIGLFMWFVVYNVL